MKEEKPTPDYDEEEEYPIFAMIGVTLLIVVAILLFLP